MGPGDLSLSLGSVKLLRDPYPPVMQAARDKVFAACRRNGIAFLEGCDPGELSLTRLDEGVRVIAGHSERGGRDRTGSSEAADAGLARSDVRCTPRPVAPRWRDVRAIVVRSLNEGYFSGRLRG